MDRRLRVALVVGAGAALFAVSALPGQAATPAFSKPVQLVGAGGGEPGIATDKKNNVYVNGPQSIPSIFNGTPGVAVWASHNDGAGFANANKARFAGSYIGGGDSDEVVAPDTGRVYLADLEAVGTAVCFSDDHGTTFNSVGPFPDPGHCGGVVVGQAGPSNDRPWLTADKKGVVYLTYHEFTTAQPLAFRSDNGGADAFAHPCGPLVTDPAIEANIPTDVTGGTLVSKPVVDGAGKLYVMFTTTTQDQNLAALADNKLSGTFSQVYMAVSSDHCQTFKNYTAFDGHKLGSNTVQFGDIFNALTIDGGGNLYAVAAGFVGTKPFPPVANLYVLSSKDHGKTWTKPFNIGPVGAHMLPAAFGGPKAGQLAVGFFHTTNGVTDPNAGNATWTYMGGGSNNATSATPSFTLTDVDRGAVYFKGAICTMGILCTSGRDLLDFTSATVDGAGCPLFTFAGEPVPGGKVFNYVTRQTAGCFRTR